MRGWRARVFLTLLLFSGGCTLNSEKLEFERGQAAAAKKDHVAAIAHFHNVVERYQRTPRALQAAEEGGRLAYYEAKKFDEAVWFYRQIILYSQDKQQRLSAQKQIAELYYGQLMNYPQAITEFNRLLQLPLTPQEAFGYRLSIARCYFYLSNFYQAQTEIDALIKELPENSQKFDALLLKANILLTTKQVDGAIETLKSILQSYSDRAKAENIGLVLAVCYEDKKDFPKAIEVLQEMKAHYPNKDFIDLRIRALQERMAQMPGARGLKK